MRKNLYGKLLLAIAISAIGAWWLGWFWGMLLFLVLLVTVFRECGIILFLCACMTQASAGELLNEAFYKALHHVETSCQLGPIKGDNGKALGPLQIHHDYWKDSGVAGKYEDCADLNYAIKVVTAYMKRYEPEAYKNRDYEALARCHNGGPNWRKKNNKHLESTKAYWLKVKKVMIELRGWSYQPIMLPPEIVGDKVKLVVVGYPETLITLEGSTDCKTWRAIDTINTTGWCYSTFMVDKNKNEVYRAYWIDNGQFDDDFWYPI